MVILILAFTQSSLSQDAISACPGRFMGFSALWIAIASLVAAFDITKAVDENGQVIEPLDEYVSALVS
jgi:cadmium resistance protein CadD (predicted permease)